MKIVHFSDTHLGFNDLDVVNEDGVNQREMDFYDAFSQVVKQIEQIRPNYIIHTGDLFHRVSPSNRAIAFALKHFSFINTLGIPFIVIAGNHSTPRTNLSSPILKIFENFENIYVVYNQEYEKFEFADAIFHCIPHINDEEKSLSQIELCKNNIDKTKKNILMMHCSVGAHYLMQEYGEWVFPKDKETIFDAMDYVALGHWHSFTQVGKYKNVYYSGSTERTSLNDKKNSKGFITITLKDKIKVKYNEIKIRPIFEFEIDCKDYDKSCKSLDVSYIKNAIVNVKLTNITPLQSIDISTAEIKKIFDKAMYVNVKREFNNLIDSTIIEDLETLSLESYFIAHIKEEIKDEEEFKRLQLKIEEFFRIYEEENYDTK